MTDTAPLTKVLSARVPALGAAVDGTEPIGTAPWAGTVTAVSYDPDSTITGANTNTRTVGVTNKAAGSGTNVVASVALVSGTNLTTDVDNVIALSGTPANLVVAANDVLVFTSVHAASGLADPGGLVQITLSRT